MITTQSPIADLAQAALDKLLANQYLPITVIGDVRPLNFPLPVERKKPAQAGGDTVQEYRPLAVLEYVHFVASGAAEAAKQRAAGKKAKAVAQEETPA